MAETISIDYRVLGIERFAGAGKLAALAIVEIELAAIEDRGINASADPVNRRKVARRTIQALLTKHAVTASGGRFRPSG